MSGSQRLRILIAGAVAAAPGQAGAAWAVLQYVLGCAALGHDVCVVEPLHPTAGPPAGRAVAAAAQAAFFREVVGYFGIKASLLDCQTRATVVGLSYAQLRTYAASCDVLVNISGMLRDQDLLTAIPRRIFLDLDPAFNQIWALIQGIDMGLDDHTHFATVGLSIGTPGCDVPTGGRTWLPITPPVATDRWPVMSALDPDAAVTLIGNWRGYGSVEHDGVHYGQRAHSFRPLFTLPGRTPERLVAALAIHPGERTDIAALAQHGWILADPQALASTPASYQDFIQSSKAELSIAKSGYVASASGWFSDRSACYLASGRPVIALDTGFSHHLPVGEGLLCFDDLDGAQAALEAVGSDYARHARAARELAEARFSARAVVAQLLAHAGSAP